MSSVHILLFRGINVGGNKIVRMETLRRVLTDAGFEGVTTYIQSGNVVFRSDLDQTSILATVETVFEPAFGFTSRPSVRNLETWRLLIADNPFTPEEGRQVHAVILDAAPAAGAIDLLRNLASTEQMELLDGVLYLHTPDGFGRSEVAKALDKVLKVPWTARNWNTVLKLREMAEALGSDSHE
jgi:uncharacterized protein (DUF1697 family)